MRELEQINAKITGTMLGFEDHGIFTWMIYLEWKGGGVGFGGYVIGGESGVDSIKEVLNTVGVEKWEDLKGKYVVVESEGLGGRALGIRNIIDESKWFRIKQWFEGRN